MIRTLFARLLQTADDETANRELASLLDTAQQVQNRAETGQNRSVRVEMTRNRMVLH